MFKYYLRHGLSSIQVLRNKLFAKCLNINWENILVVFNYYLRNISQGFKSDVGNYLISVQILRKTCSDTLNQKYHLIHADIFILFRLYLLFICCRVACPSCVRSYAPTPPWWSWCWSWWWPPRWSSWSWPCVCVLCSTQGLHTRILSSSETGTRVDTVGVGGRYLATMTGHEILDSDSDKQWYNSFIIYFILSIDCYKLHIYNFNYVFSISINIYYLLG